MAGPSTHGGRAPVGRRGSKYGREPSPVLVSHVQKGLLEPGSAELTINFHLKRSAVVEIRVDGSDETPPFPTRIEVLGGGSSFGSASTCLSQGLANEASKPLSIRRRDTRS